MYTIEQFTEILENYVEVDQIKGEDNFKSDLGLSSFDTMCLINDVKNELGIELTAKDFVEHKTVGEMSAHISSLK